MTITANDLPGILEKHSLWLCGEPGGVRADLTRANLTRANLTKANLTRSALIGNRPIFQMGPIGSEDRYIVAYNTGSGIKIMAGCFFGTLAAFLEKVEKTHGPNRHGRDYRAAVAMIETFFSEVLP